MNYIDKIMEEMSDKSSDSANYFGSVISLEDAQEILERHLKPSEEKGEEICIRCGLDKKTVRKEGSNGCYLYGDKMANTHLRHKPKRSNHKK